MDDRFLNDQRREPRPEFSRSLRGRLRDSEAAETGRPAFRMHPALSGALAAAAVAVAFTFPAVRATAQQVLELFRVREFAVVQVDENRMDRLKAANIDPGTVFGGSLETLQDPGETLRFTDPAAAAQAAGFEVLRPAAPARSLAPESVFVRRESRVRVTVDARPLRQMMDLMEVRDLDLPAGLDGQRIEARLPAMVVQTYRSEGRRRAAFVQSESPEISMPPGVELPRLGEIGLRVLGVGRDEARRLARAIDWHTTLLVPVVASATQFQQVSVNGARGVMLETTSTATPDGSDRGPGRVLLWTRDGRVYALLGNIAGMDMVQMAESVR